MQPTLNETRLLWEARALLPEIEPLEHDRLAAAVAKHGIDAVTAALYVLLCDAHRPFVDAVDRFEPVRGSLPALPGELWVVPAAGFRERPEYGGDGSVIRSVAEDFGMPTKTLQTSSLGSIAENAMLLRRFLSEAPPRSVMIVTLSKGAAELKVALREPGPHREALYAWLNVVGLPEGTPLLDYGRSHPSTWMLVRLMMLLRRIQSGFLEGLSHRAPLLRGPVDIPEGMLAVSVVALPLRSHLDGSIAARHGYLSPLGPNDGFGLILDALQPGPVYPVWGASHYLRKPGLSRTFYGILAQIAAQLR